MFDLKSLLSEHTESSDYSFRCEQGGSLSNWSSFQKVQRLTLSSNGTSVTDKMTLSFDKLQLQLFLSVVEMSVLKPGLSPVSSKQLIPVRQLQVPGRVFYTAVCKDASFS